MADHSRMCRIHARNEAGGLQMTDLFCTPEQGQRLKELLPELDSTLIWIEEINVNDEKEWDIAFSTGIPKQFHINFNATPALTLQELRDVARDHNKSFDELLAYRLHFDTAPELADWVIARLEGKP